MGMWKYDATMFNNRPSVERLDNLPITAGTPYTVTVPLSAPIGGASPGGILPGDVFVIVSEFQVTSPHSYDVMISSVLRVNDTTAPALGVEVGEGNGQNFNDSEHHFVVRKSGIWVADKAYASRYINLNVWTASTAMSPGDELVVDQDYGFIHVLQLRANDAVGAPTGGWQLIQSKTASSSATIDFTSGLNNTYDHYMVAFENVKPTVNDAGLAMRAGIGAGPTWPAGAGAYFYGMSMPGSSTSGAGTTTLIPLTFSGGGSGIGLGGGGGTSQHVSGMVYFTNPENADYPNFRYETVYNRAADTAAIGTVGRGDYGGAGALTGLRFLMTSGNIASGRFSLYGLVK